MPADDFATERPVEDDLPSTSPGHLFALVRDGYVQTRRELIEYTGLSKVTVAQRVDALITGGLLREQGDAASTGGRRPRRLVPDLETKTVLTAALGATHGQVAVLDGAGSTIVEHSIESRIADGPTVVLGRVVRVWKQLLRKCRRDITSVCGVGLGVPGPVNVATARLARPPIMPGWDDYPIREHLAGQFDAPVFVDNDANLMALGEWRLVHRNLTSLLFVKISTGIGAGLVLNGELYRGIDGGAGDIGHVKIPAADGVPCTCGLTGCLAAVASGGALARRLRDNGYPQVIESRDVVRLVQAGNADAIAAVRNAGHLLGDVLATAVSLLNPTALVIGGDMADTYEHFMSALHESLILRAQPLALAHLHVGASRLGERAGIAGAGQLVLAEVFSPAAIDQRLGLAG